MNSPYSTQRAADTETSFAPFALWVAGSLICMIAFVGAVLDLRDPFSREFRRLGRGMSADQVRGILGDPDRIIPPVHVASVKEKGLHEKFGIGYLWWIYDRPVLEGGEFPRYFAIFDGDQLIDAKRQLVERD